MDYRVLITPDAENDLEEFVKYLVIDKKNKQAAERSCALLPVDFL